MSRHDSIDDRKCAFMSGRDILMTENVPSCQAVTLLMTDSVTLSGHGTSDDRQCGFMSGRGTIDDTT